MPDFAETAWWRKLRFSAFISCSWSIHWLVILGCLHRRGLVEEVNRLIREAAAWEVAGGEHNGLVDHGHDTPVFLRHGELAGFFQHRKGGAPVTGTPDDEADIVGGAFHALVGMVAAKAEKAVLGDMARAVRFSPIHAAPRVVAAEGQPSTTAIYARLSVDPVRIAAESATGAILEAGVRWRLESPCRSQSAAVSRALTRLEGRGLLQRRNQRTGDNYGERMSPAGIMHWEKSSGGRRFPHQIRATHVMLTTAGRATAERLANEENQNG